MERRREGREYVRAAGLPLFPATHASETFKSFWRQKERCRPLREPKLDSRRGRQPHTRHLFKKNPPRSPLHLSLSPPPSPPLSFPDVCLTKFEPPHNQPARRRVACVNASPAAAAEGRGGEAALRLPTDRVRTASSSRIECGVRPSRTPSCKSPANPCLEVTRTQGSDSFPSFLPSPGGCGAV